MMTNDGLKIRLLYSFKALVLGSSLSRPTIKINRLDYGSFADLLQAYHPAYDIFAVSVFLVGSDPD